MAENKHIKICFVTEKVVEHGEDAPPLLVEKGNSCAVGVFDGMGGAGAATCDSDFGEGLTKAFVASRIIKETILTFLTDNLGTKEICTNDLKESVIERLKKEQELFPPKSKSMLRSKLVREYPTTMALVTLQNEDKIWKVDSYWAGDSHCYLWNKEGFFQISKDDLEDNNDPMENLHNDSPISNCICADRDFVIHHLPIQLAKEPTVILCATDGCFGYYQSPMHFEHMLKSCLQQAKDEEEWKEKIKDEVLKVTGDDSSLSLIACGFSSFTDLKVLTASNAMEGFSELLKAEQDLACAKQMLAEAKEKYERNVEEGWNNYKRGYMKYLNIEENGNA